MKALVCQQLGGLEHVAWTEAPNPSLGPDEVLIAVRAAGLNYLDQLLMVGAYPYRPEPPFVLGAECAGVVVDVGARVAHLGLGDRVYAYTTVGSMAELIAVAAHRVFRIPGSLDFEEAGQLGITAHTAWYGLVRRARVSHGDCVLVLGATGATGLAACLVAKLHGATVVGMGGAPQKLATLERLGIEKTVSYSDGSIADRIRRVTGGVDVIFDCVGGAALQESLDLLQPGGRLVLVGATSGQINTFSVMDPLSRDAEFHGVSLGVYVKRAGQSYAQDASHIAAAIEQGRLRLTPGKVWSVTAYREAYDAFASRRVCGKIILTIPS